MLQDGDTALINAVGCGWASYVVHLLLERKDIDPNARNQVCMGQYQANRIQRAWVGAIGPFLVLGGYRTHGMMSG